MIRIFISALCVALALTQVSPPVWPQVFNQRFVQSYNSTRFTITGNFYFDSNNGLMRVDRSDGQYDLVCGSIVPNLTLGCTQLIRDGKRYVIHPQQRRCCMCCDAAHGCGVMRRDWLSTSKYQGQQILSGQPFYKWSIPDGSITDFYYATKTEQRIPRRIDTGGGLKLQDFIMNTFSTQPIPSNVFALPDYCTSTCPATTVCGKFQSVPFFKAE